MSKRLDIAMGDSYGRWLVTGQLRHKGRLKYSVICECGSESLVEASSLVSGASKSCGCLHKETISSISTSHGMSRSRTYKSWEMMVQRCTNPNYLPYQKYGAKGVTVCESWKDFANFVADMGERPPSKTLNRKIDPEKGEPFSVYSKETCEWSSFTDQSYDTVRKLTTRVAGPECLVIKRLVNTGCISLRAGLPLT